MASLACWLRFASAFRSASIASSCRCRRSASFSSALSPDASCVSTNVCCSGPVIAFVASPMAAASLVAVVSPVAAVAVVSPVAAASLVAAVSLVAAAPFVASVPRLAPSLACNSFPSSSAACDSALIPPHETGSYQVAGRLQHMDRAEAVSKGWQATCGCCVISWISTRSLQGRDAADMGLGHLTGSSCAHVIQVSIERCGGSRYIEECPCLHNHIHLASQHLLGTSLLTLIGMRDCSIRTACRTCNLRNDPYFKVTLSLHVCIAMPAASIWAKTFLSSSGSSAFTMGPRAMDSKMSIPLARVSEDPCNVLLEPSIFPSEPSSRATGV